MELPGNVMFVGDYDSGQLEKNKKYNNMTSAVNDANSGDIIICTFPKSVTTTGLAEGIAAFSYYPYKEGVTVIFAEDLGLYKNTEPPYYYWRGIFTQAGTSKIQTPNTVAVSHAEGRYPDGTFVGNKDITIADEYYHAGSSRAGVGRYLLQFRTSVSGVMQNRFHTNIESSFTPMGIEKCFEKNIYPLFEPYPGTDPPVQLGWLIFPANAVTGDFDIIQGRLLAVTLDMAGAYSDNLLFDQFVYVKSHCSV